MKAFLDSPFSPATFSISSRSTPNTQITFAPHTEQDATKILDAIAARIEQEGKKSKDTGSVLFTVMQIDKGKSPVYDILNTIHENQKIFSYGISDSPKASPCTPSTRRPASSSPASSSNLALGGEQENGDNLLEIHDKDVATVFAIEAVALVDHFDFLDRLSGGSKKSGKKTPPASKKQAATSAGWFLSTNDTGPRNTSIRTASTTSTAFSSAGKKQGWTTAASTLRRGRDTSRPSPPGGRGASGRGSSPR